MVVFVKKKLSDFKESELIEKISEECNNSNVLVGIGDDAAVVSTSGKKMVFTADVLVEENHFSRKWFSPKQIGMKCVEANVSDIGSMGASPKYILVSLVLPKETEVEFLEELYAGIHEARKNYGVDLIGGNMSNGEQIVVDIFVVGETCLDNLPLRSNAKPGDCIVVSKPVGGAHSGWNLFKKGVEGFNSVKKMYLEPKADVEWGLKNAGLVHAMEDVSDGVASEVRNICNASRCGAEIFHEKIPVHKEAEEACKAMNFDARDFALFGGEDYALVATVPEENLDKVNGTVVGKIVEGSDVVLEKNSVKEKLERFGWDHFRKE